MIRTLPSIVDGTAVYTKQPEESPTPYAAMISKKMGLMDFQKVLLNWKDWCVD